MRFLRLLLGTLLICQSLCLFAQPERQADNWHFGDSLAISFVNGVPVLNPPSSMFSFQGCTALSDSNGQLLFYTNGGGLRDIPGYIWNRNHEEMYVIQPGEGGGYSARQAAIALPDPAGRPDIYYLFTVDNTETGGVGNGVSYFVIDMSRNEGLGEVIEAGVDVTMPAFEALEITPMAGGEGYWLITSEFNADNARYVTVPITADGVGEPVFRAFPGRPQPQRFDISPDGSFMLSQQVLYRFDNTTGEIGEALLPLPNLGRGNVFTADSRFLYVNEGTTRDDIAIVRYNLATLDRQEIQRYVETPSRTVLTNQGPMQLGPNGNIYFVESVNDFVTGQFQFGLTEITCTANVNPVVNRFLIDLRGITEALIMPTPPAYVDAIFSQINLIDNITLDTLTVSSCNPADGLTLRARRQGETYLWSDGSTGDSLVVTEAGTYTVTIDEGCRQITDIQQVINQAIDPDNYGIIAITEENRLCAGLPGSFTIAARAGAPDLTAIEWSDGSVGDTATITLDDTRTVSATLTDSCGAIFELDFTPSQECECSVAFPEIISANRDGLNDVFTAFSNCALTDFNLTIFNRWGQEIFSTTNPEQQFDGTVDGTPVNLGSYLYLATYRVVGETETVQAEGQFVVVR